MGILPVNKTDSHGRGAHDDIPLIAGETYWEAIGDLVATVATQSGSARGMRRETRRHGSLPGGGRPD